MHVRLLGRLLRASDAADLDLLVDDNGTQHVHKVQHAVFMHRQLLLFAMQIALNLQPLLELGLNLLLLILNLLALHLLNALALASGVLLTTVASLTGLAFFLLFARLSSLLLVLFLLHADELHLSAYLAVHLLLGRCIAALLALSETRRAQLSVEHGGGAIG